MGGNSRHKLNQYWPNNDPYRMSSVVWIDKSVKYWKFDQNLFKKQVIIITLDIVNNDPISCPSQLVHMK